MTSRFLMKLRKKNSEKKVVETSIAFIKDSLITQVQPMMSSKEIIDVDIPGLQDPTVRVTYYLRKGKVV